MARLWERLYVIAPTLGPPSIADHRDVGHQQQRQQPQGVAAELEVEQHASHEDREGFRAQDEIYAAHRAHAKSVGPLTNETCFIRPSAKLVGGTTGETLA